jgi:hypothetical protein
MSTLSCAVVDLARQARAQGVRRVWLRDDLFESFLSDMTDGRYDLTGQSRHELRGYFGLTIHTPTGTIVVSARGLRT